MYGEPVIVMLDQDAGSVSCAGHMLLTKEGMPLTCILSMGSAVSSVSFARSMLNTLTMDHLPSFVRSMQKSSQHGKVLRPGGNYNQQKVDELVEIIVGLTFDFECGVLVGQV